MVRIGQSNVGHASPARSTLNPTQFLFFICVTKGCWVGQWIGWYGCGPGMRTEPECGPNAHAGQHVASAGARPKPSWARIGGPGRYARSIEGFTRPMCGWAPEGPRVNAHTCGPPQVGWTSMRPSEQAGPRLLLLNPTRAGAGLAGAGLILSFLCAHMPSARFGPPYWPRVQLSVRAGRCARCVGCTTMRTFMQTSLRS